MRRLKRTSFSESGPPAEWERRFAAIVRESRRIDPAASDAAGHADPRRESWSWRDNTAPADAVPPAPGWIDPARDDPAHHHPAAADGGGTTEVEWARSWPTRPPVPGSPGAADREPADPRRAQSVPADAGMPEPPLDQLSFEGFDPFAGSAEPVASGKRSALSRLKRRLVRVARRKTRPKSAARDPAAAGPESRVPGTGSASVATPDFPRRPSAGAAVRPAVCPAVRPGAAAWLSRTDGPLRTTAPVPVAGPAVAAALVIVLSGLSAAYLTHRLGIDFGPEAVRGAAVSADPLRAVADAVAPVAEAPAGAPTAASPAAPVTIGPSQALAVPGPRPPEPPLLAMPPPALAPAPAPVTFAAPPPPAGPRPAAALGGPAAEPQTVRSVGPGAAPLAIVAGPPPAAAIAPTAVAEAAKWPETGPAPSGIPTGPAEILASTRPVFVMAAPQEWTTELVPSLPFPIEQLTSRGAGADAAGLAGIPGASYGPVPALAAPLVPAAAFAAEAITADTVDAVPADRRPSDARLDDRARPRPAASGPDEETRPGSPLVIGVQRALRRHGIDPGPVDGMAGPRTVAAVRSYQRRIGEQPDGVVDIALLRHLERTPPRQLADGVAGRPAGRDPLAGLVRALGDLFGLPANRGTDRDGPIASAGGPQGDGDPDD